MYLKTVRFAVSIAALTLVLVSGSSSLSQEDQLQKPAKPIRLTTAAFRIDVNLPSRDAANQAKQVAEKTWEIASRCYGCDPPSKPLQGTIYRDTESYREMDQQLTDGQFQRNLAFAHFDSLSAHVALQPFVTDEGMVETGLPTLTAQLFSHELAHLVRYHSFPNTFRDHPTWLFHGMASWIDRQVVFELSFTAEDEADPKACSSIFRARKLIASNQFPSVEELLANDIEEMDFHETYDACWLFVSSLMKNHPREMETFLRKLKRLGGGSGYAKRSAELLLETLNSDEATLNIELKQYIKSLRPKWFEEYRSLETAGESWFQVGFPETNAAAWQSAALPGSFRVIGKLTIHPGTNKQCNLRLGKPGSFTQFSLTSGYGLNVFRFGDKKWKNTDRKELKVETGTPINFELGYEREIETVSLKLDDKVVYLKRMKIPEVCQFGLSVQNGAVVEWQKMTVTEK